MSLTRKALSAMGIEDDKIDQIIEMHSETVNALKEERDNFKADAAKLPGVQKELDEAKKAMENGDKSPYKVKYEAMVEERDNLRKEFDDYKAAQEAQETLVKKGNAYKALLLEAGVSEKRIDAIMKVTNLDDFEIGKDGKAKDAEKLIEGVKTEWADFIVASGVQGADVTTPPDHSNNGGFSNMSLSEKMEYANSHPDDPGVKAWLDS